MKKEITYPTSGFFMIVNRWAYNSRFLSLTKRKELNAFKKFSLVLFLIILTLTSAGILTAYAQAPNISYEPGTKVYPVGSVIPTLTPDNSGGGSVPADIYITSTIASSFFSPRGIVTDAAGNVYVGENGTGKIYRITPQGGVSHFAGDGGYGTYNGTPGFPLTASFKKIDGMAIDASGSIYVVDGEAKQIRKITAGGVVTTIAGIADTSNPFADGPGATATFSSPRDVAVDAAGNLYVADSGNNKIRKITFDGGGNASVSTLAGSGAAGSTNDPDGALASFDNPAGIMVDPSGNVYVSDRGNSHKIRRITPSGAVSTFSGSGGYSSNDGDALTATFIDPRSLTIDASGNIYVVDETAHEVRKIDPLGAVVTVAGTGSSSSTDGIGTAAGFNSPVGITTDASGNLYISDAVNAYGAGTVRKITTTGYTINPALPAGLSFNGGTGVITGTPTTVVAAADYTITAYNESGSSSATVSIATTPNADLSSLVLSAGTLSPTFAADVITYTASVPFEDASITLTPTAPGGGATIEVNGTGVLSGNASGAISLTVGDNIITTVVTNGSATKTYTLTLTRQKGNQTVIFTAPSSITYGAASFAVGPTTSDAGLAVSYTLDNSKASLSNGNILTILEVGSVTITATMSASADYNSASVTHNLTINAAPLTITANPLSKTYGDLLNFAGTEFTTSGLVYSDAVSSATISSSGSATTAAASVSPYVITISTAQGSGLSNYDITYVTGGLTVTAAPLTITASAQSKTYGDPFSFTGTEFTTSGLLNTDAVTSANISSAGTPVTAAASVSPYAITISTAQGSGLSNYDITYVAGALTVTTAPLTITASAQSKTYGDLFNFTGTEFTTIGLLNSDAANSATLNSTGSATTTAASVSPYTINISAATGTGLDNYTITYVTGGLTVSPKTITVTADAKSKIYGSADPALTYSIPFGALADGYSLSGSLSRTAGENVDSYAINQGSLTDPSGNYTLGFVGANFSISQKPITITADAGQNKAYGLADPGLNYTLTSGSLEFGDSFTGSLSRTAGESVAGGPYAINQGSVTAGGNYNLSFIGANFSIITRLITITADPQSKMYGSADPALTYTLTSGSLESGDSITGLLSRASGESVAGGPYAIGQGSVTAGSNYSLNFIGADFTIITKPVIITADAKSKVYGSADPALTYTLTSGSLESGDSITGLLSRASGESVAGGPYAIGQGSVTAGSNYSLNFIGADFTIITKPVIITADAKSKVYGSADPALTYTLTSGSLESGDSITGLLSRAAGETVAGGPYAISQGTVTAGSNYALTFASDSFRINQKPITITADAKSKVYGSSDPALTYSITSGSLESGESLSGLLNRAAGENTGSYAIGQGTLADASGNYNLTFSEASFDITKTLLTITADNKSKVQGTANPVLTVSYSGFVNNEDSDVLTEQPTLITNAATPSVAGTYDITVMGAAADNYTIIYVNGTLTVVPGPLSNNSNLSALSITGGELNEAFNPNTLVYTASVANATAAIKVSPTVADQTASVTVNGNNPSTDIALTEGGITEIGIVVTAQDNTTKTYTIQVSRPAANAVDQSIAFVPIQPKAYGDAAFNLGAVNSSAGLAVTYTAADPTVVSITGNVASILKAGTTLITASQAGNANVNAAPDVTQTLTVSPKAITVTANANQGKVYGSADPDLTYTITSGGALAGTDSFAGSLSRSVGETVAGGPYDIKQGTLTAGGNYTLTFVGTYFTINKAPLTITADNKSKTYGDVLAFAGTEFTASGLLNDDAVNAATVSSTGSAATAPVNNYPVDVSAATGTGLDNYSITYVPGNLTVGKAALTITADNASKVQGTANPAFTATYTGFVNGDNNTTGLSAQPTIATNATNASAAGTYTITAGGATAANYTISYVNGTLTVTPGAGSNNADLSNLSISSGTGVLFVPGTLAYSASVSNVTTSIGVIPTAADANATIKVNGATVSSGSSLSVSLMVGINTIITEVTAENGTITTYTLTINRLEANAPEVITASNIMSPNGDGVNDMWMIKDIELYPNNEVIVFDRDGREVFKERGYRNTWNASINGSPLNTGTYYYIVNFGPDKGIIKGFITIVREQ